jgi:predicted nucleic acid-binding protein
MNQKVGWATCPITVNGCVRILSHPAYPTVKASSGEVAAALRQFCSTPHHHFWPDTVSLLDEALFQPGWIGGPRGITDVYLLGLAVRNHGRLVTFDRGIPLKAVKGASSKNLVVLNG